MIVNYIIVSFYSFRATTEEVQKLLQSGWQPWGDLQVTHSNLSTQVYSQAMVRFKAAPVPSGEASGASLGGPAGMETQVHLFCSV